MMMMMMVMTMMIRVSGVDWRIRWGEEGVVGIEGRGKNTGRGSSC